jgi:hypothetical protein
MNDRPNRNASRAKNPKSQGEGAAESVANEFAESASRVKDEATRAGDQAIRTGRGVFERNAETVQHALQSGVKMASAMAERSATQLGRAFDFSGGEANERSSRSIEAVVQSSAMMIVMMQRMHEEWWDMAGARIERGFDRMSAMMQARTPQDIIALQSEMLRDNIETFLGFARKAGEHSTRFAEEAKRRFGTLAEGRKST